jgi:hypothetical protein
VAHVLHSKPAFSIAISHEEETMPNTQSNEDKKRLDPYDPRTGATGNDEPPADEDEDIEGDEEVETDGDELGG